MGAGWAAVPQEVGAAEAAFTRGLGQPLVSEAVRKQLEEPSVQAQLRALPWFTGTEMPGPGSVRGAAAQEALELLAAVAKVCAI